MMVPTATPARRTILLVLPFTKYGFPMLPYVAETGLVLGTAGKLYAIAICVHDALLSFRYQV